MFRYGVLNLFLLLVLAGPSLAQERQVIAGAGPSTRVVELFFNSFAEQPIAADYQFSIPLKSTKHRGGIDNSDTYLFGRTGRPLNEGERARGKDEIFLAMVPIVFVAGDGVRIHSLSMRELELIYRHKIDNWKRVGGVDAEIITVGREPTEALFTELKNYYFFFHQAEFDRIFYRDHEVVDFLRSAEGRYAIAFGAKANFYGMNLIYIKEDLQAGVRVGLVYDLKNRDHPLVQAVREYAHSDEWRQVLRRSRLGLEPVRSPHAPAASP